MDHLRYQKYKNKQLNSNTLELERSMRGSNFIFESV